MDTTEQRPPAWGPFGLDGRVALVTGGARGIGLGIARRFQEAGARVVVLDVATSTPTTVAEQLPAAAAVVGDLGDEAGHETLIAEASGPFGPVDVLVNCAGIYPGRPFLEIDSKFFDTMYAVNLRGLALLTQAFASQLISRSLGGKVVNIASVDGLRPSRLEGGAVYGATKAGVIGLTAHLAREFGPHGIAVNGIAPGMIETEGTQRDRSGDKFGPAEHAAFVEAAVARLAVGRRGQPDDIAKVAVFLASPAADYVSGQTLCVDGGWMNS
jgi:2-deoxy-D-gluconate 3-dehydrogenase